MNKIKNIDKVCERIKQAVKNKEKIIIYGDSDMDGISSVVILEEAIKNLGGEAAAVVFPNREEDGYGINLKALDFLAYLAPALFITLDLGIGNVKEVEIGNKMGFEFMIIDHHEPLEILPKAKIIVDPKLRSQGDRESSMTSSSGQKGDESGFEYLCNAGLTFKIIEELLSENLSDSTKNSLLELVALATISDMMPQIEDNKFFIENGLKSIAETFRPGIRALFDVLGKGEVVSGGFVKMISVLNTAESISFQNESYKLLTESSDQKCREIVENLVSKLKYKQQKIKQITEEVERRIAQKGDETIIFEGDPAWKLVLAGPVASTIAAKYEKPIFIYKKMDNESTGSVRSLKEGQNSVEAMSYCKDILITYGGHPKASGFRIKNEKLEEFKNRLKQYFMEHGT